MDIAERTAPVARGGGLHAWRPGLGLLGIMLLAAGLRFFRLGELSLWMDEGFSWWWAHFPQAVLWDEGGATETNPPLYFALQRAWLVFGDSEAALRSLSALLGVALVPATYLLARALVDMRTSLLAALLVALSAPLVEYSQEARTYMLLTLCGTLALAGLTRFIRRPDDNRALALYVAATIAALYSHNTAFLLPGLASVAVLVAAWAGRPQVRRLLIAWLAANAIVLLAWAYWVPVVLHQARTQAVGIDWLVQRTPDEWLGRVLRLYGLDNLPALMPWILILLPMPLFAVPNLWRPARERAGLALLALFALGVPALIWLLGYVVRPLFLERTVLWPLPAGLVLIAAGITAIRSARWRRVLTAGAIGVFALNTGLYFRHVEKEPWRQAIARVAEHWREGDVLLSFPSSQWRVIRYYTTRQEVDMPLLAVEEPYRFDRVFDFVGEEIFEGVVPTRFSEVDERLAETGRVWTLLYQPEVWDTDRIVRDALLAHGRLKYRERLDPKIEIWMSDPDPRLSAGIRRGLRSPDAPAGVPANTGVFSQVEAE